MTDLFTGDVLFVVLTTLISLVLLGAIWHLGRLLVKFGPELELCFISVFFCLMLALMLRLTGIGVTNLIEREDNHEYRRDSGTQSR